MIFFLHVRVKHFYFRDFSRSLSSFLFCFLVNYLEFGKNWEDLSREPGGEEDEITSGFDVEKVRTGGEWRKSPHEEIS